MTGLVPNGKVERKRTLSIRGRLALSFLTILGLFALNLAVYSVSNIKRKDTVEALRRAISSQILIADINQRLNDTQKQIALLNQTVADSGVGASAEDLAGFKSQISTVRSKIRELSSLSDGEIRTRVTQFSKDYDALSASWLVFYQEFGVHYAIAITELAMRADPLSQHVLQQTVPEILDAEKKHVDSASATFYSVGTWADRLTVVIFLLSGFVAVVIALRLSSHIDRGLNELKSGAARIGSGAFHQPIQIRSDDELGELATTFNAMSAQLQTAHSNLTQANTELANRHEEMQRQRELSDSLLRNILPAQVADELREKDSVDPKYFEDVTILFTDFVGFSNSTRDLSAEDLVYLLHDYFTEFDNITTRYGLEKLKTIGDSYMCVGGLPVRSPSHPVDTVLAALELLDAVRKRARDGPSWGVRIGIHTGPVIAGVVGIRKFAFDIWGESVNLSSRMESSGAEGCINISQQTYARVKDFFACESRGQVVTKDKVGHDMFFVRGVLPGLLRRSEEEVGVNATPAAFARRYGIYFQKEPPAFPQLSIADWSRRELSMPTPEPELDQLLRTAIQETRLLRLRYRNQERIVEPHDYGEHDGVIKLLTYQVGGSSSGPLPNWRWMETNLISDAHLLDQTFPGGRPTQSGKHHKWDKLFLRVKPASKEQT